MSRSRWKRNAVARVLPIAKSPPDPFFSRAHHGHRGAMTRRFRHIECQIGEIDRSNCSPTLIVDAGLRKQEGHLRSVSRSTAEEHLDERRA